MKNSSGPPLILTAEASLGIAVHSTGQDCSHLRTRAMKHDAPFVMVQSILTVFRFLPRNSLYRIPATQKVDISNCIDPLNKIISLTSTIYDDYMPIKQKLFTLQK